MATQTSTLLEAITPTENTFATTPGQERFWFLDRLAPDSARVNMALAFRLRGPLDAFALLNAVNLLQARHEVLRTTFHVQEGKLVQRVHERLEAGLSLLDLSASSESERESESARLRHDFARIPLNLEVGPPIAFRLLRFGQEDHILMVTLSHLVCDGWSNGILLRDLCELYGAAVERRASTLPELPVQYADYAESCREWLDSGGHQAGLQIICDEIRVPEHQPSLPSDFERGTATPDGDIATLLLPDKTVHRLRDFCRMQEVTNFEVLLAAFEIFLVRFTSCERLLISTLVANRMQREVKDLIGLFANPQIIPAVVSSGETARDVLDRAREWSRNAQEHQNVPFEIVLDRLHAGNAQFALETSFLYQKAFMQPGEAGGVRFEPIRSVSPGAIYTLGLNIVERIEGPRLQMEYDPALYRPETIEQMLSGYAAIVDHILVCPDLPVEQLPWPVELASRTFARQQHAQVEAPSSKIREIPLVRPDRVSTSGTAIEYRMTEVWQRVLKISPIPPSASVKDLGASSLSIVRLLAEIWREFEVSLPITVFLESPTIRSLSERVQQATGQASSSTAAKVSGQFEGPEPEQTVVCLAEGPPGPSIFCIYGIYLYGPLATKFAGERTVYGAYQRMELRLLERGVWSDELKVLTNVETLAALYLEEIERVQPEGPYHFVGESFGGFVAYEMAQQLRRKGKEVELLAVIDMPAPGYRRAKSLPKRLALHASHFRREGFPYLAAKLGPHIERLRDRLAAVRKQRVSAAANAPDDAEVTERARRTLRRSVRAQAMNNYHPKPYPGKVLLVRAMDNDDFVETNGDRDWGWHKLAQGGVDVVDVPGDHLSVLAEPNVGSLAAEIRRRIPRLHASEHMDRSIRHAS
jgi:thioesterase domain-containing protein/acyl carrier protein